MDQIREAQKRLNLIIPYSVYEEVTRQAQERNTTLTARIVDLILSARTQKGA